MAGTIYNVSSAAQLMSALAQVKGGETIQLASGDYGCLKLNQYSGFSTSFPSNVTITSADPDHPASFSGLALGGVKNLTFDNVAFDYSFTKGDQQYTRDFMIHSSSNIIIRNSVFDGDVASGMTASDNGYGIATGLDVRWSTGITIEDTEFSNFYRAVSVSESSGITLRGNDVHDIRSDGLNFSAVSKVLIEDNYIHDFQASYASGDHRDMIQFWTTGTKVPSTDIIIRSNTLDMGEGSYTQSIFMRNEVVDQGLAGTGMYYQNVLIEDNVIYNGHMHGITVGETKGLVIRDNSVLRVVDADNPDHNASGVWVPQINVAPKSQTVTIEGNITGGVAGNAGQAGWAVRGNAFVQDTNSQEPGYYGNVFVGSSLDLKDGAHGFVVLPGGMIDKLGAGAADTIYAPISAKADAEFHIVEPADNGATRVFDASFSTGPLGKLPAGTVYQWDFGDGTSATGKVIEHDYAAGGKYAVKLLVTLPDGSKSVETGEVAIAGPKVLSLGLEGAFHAYAYGEETTLATAATALRTVSTGTALDLGKTGALITIKGTHLETMRGADNFDIDVSLKADLKGSTGEIFRSHNSFLAGINAKGELQFQLTTTTTPSLILVTKGLVLNDGRVHDVSVHFGEGRLQLIVDGKVAASAAVSGTLSPTELRELTFGNPWGQKNFDGSVSTFDIATDKAHYPIDGHLVLGETGSVIVEPVVEAPVVIPVEHVASHGWDTYSTDLSDLVAGGKVKLFDNAHLTTDAGKITLDLDGVRDYVSLGRLQQFEASDKIAFDIDFQRDAPDATTQRLLLNHQKIGVSLQGDGLVVQVATATEGFKAFKVADLGLRDTDQHHVMVMLDAKTDHLQVLLDDKVVMDVQNTNFDIVGAGGGEWGWTVSSPWNEFFNGEISGLHFGDRFEFLHDYVPAQSHLILA